MKLPDHWNRKSIISPSRMIPMIDRCSMNCPNLVPSYCFDQLYPKVGPRWLSPSFPKMVNSNFTCFKNWFYKFSLSSGEAQSLMIPSSAKKPNHHPKTIQSWNHRNTLVREDPLDISIDSLTLKILLTEGFQLEIGMKCVLIRMI